MSALLLLALLLLAIGVCCALYLAAWWTLGVQRGSKEGSYVVNSDTNNAKLYSGLDMVDEGQERQRLVLKEDEEEERSEGKEVESHETDPVQDKEEHEERSEEKRDEADNKEDKEEEHHLPQDSPA